MDSGFSIRAYFPFMLNQDTNLYASFVINYEFFNINNNQIQDLTPLGRQQSKIVIPASVTSIGWGAFEGATSLISITIPASVISIGDGAFEQATSLTTCNI